MGPGPGHAIPGPYFARRRQSDTKVFGSLHQVPRDLLPSICLRLFFIFPVLKELDHWTCCYFFHPKRKWQDMVFQEVAKDAVAAALDEASDRIAGSPELGAQPRLVLVAVSWCRATTLRLLGLFFLAPPLELCLESSDPQKMVGHEPTMFIVS